MENAHLAEGYDYISILTSKINAALVRRFRELEVKMISTRTIGYDHIDLDAARSVIRMKSAMWHTHRNVWQIIRCF